MAVKFSVIVSSANTNSMIPGLAMLFSTKLQEEGKDYMCPCHLSQQMHTGCGMNTHMPYQRTVPTLPYRANGG